MELVDTNVLSELMRPTPNPGVLAWRDQVSSLAVSVVTIEEIHFGLTAKPNERLMREVEALLDGGYVTILAVDAAIAARAGMLRGRFRREGISRTAADMLIAATALHHDLPLVTRNVRDFDSTGIEIRNPFG